MAVLSSILLFLLLCHTLPAREWTVDAGLEVSGNRRMTVSDWRELLRAGEVLDEKQLQQVLDLALRAAAEEALPLCELVLDRNPESGVIHSLRVEEGPLFRMGQLRLESELEDLEASGFLPPETLLRHGTLEEGLRLLLQELEKRGRARARLRVLSMQLWPVEEELRLDLELRLEQAQEIRPLSVHFQGLQNSRPQTLQRLARLKEGQLFSPLRNREARRRLLRTGWFARVDGPLLALGPEGEVLLVEVEELPSYRFDGLLSLLPGEENRLAFDLRLDLENLLGTGRRLNLEAARPDGVSQELLFRYREPFVLGLPLGAALQVHQQIQDSSWLVRSGAVELDLELGADTRVGGFLGSREVIPDSSNGYHLLGMDRSSSWSAGAWLELDRRDESLNPRSGWKLRLEAEQRERQSLWFRGLPPRDEDRRILSRSSELQWVLPPPLLSATPAGRNTALSFRFFGGLLSPGDPPLEERVALGGETGPRGYREGQFRALDWLLLQGELRWLAPRGGRFYLFWDSADFRTAAGRLRRHGRGLGLRLPIPQGVFSLELALGEELAPGRALLHFRVLSRF